MKHLSKAIVLAGSVLLMGCVEDGSYVTTTTTTYVEGPAPVVSCYEPPVSVNVINVKGGRHHDRHRHSRHGRGGYYSGSVSGPANNGYQQGSVGYQGNVSGNTQGSVGYQGNTSGAPASGYQGGTQGSVGYQGDASGNASEGSVGYQAPAGNGFSGSAN